MAKKVKTSKRAKRKLSRNALMLIAGLITILVPCLIFGGILLSAALDTGTPIFGDRYTGDLEPAIEDSEMEAISATIVAMDNVESVNITLISGQLRVNVNVSDDLTSEEIAEMVELFYEAIIEDLPIETYFTSTDERKMYDLAINVYNYIDAEDEGMIYYILTKNAMMEEYSIQLVSEAVDEELASDLRGDNDTEEEETETEE